MAEGLIEVAIGGLGLGSIYAMVAIGFVVVYKASGVLNFANGTIGAAGGLIMASLVTDGGLGLAPLAGANPLTGAAGSLPGWLANLGVAMILAALLGAGLERLCVRPLLGRSPFTVTVATIGLSIALGMVVDLAPIARDLRVPWTNETWRIGPAIVAVSSFAAMGLGLVSVVALMAFNRSRWGLALRAVAADHEAAAVQGIDPRRVHTLAWALAAALGTVAAVAFSFSPLGAGVIATGLTPALFFRALPVIALGGWDSYAGAYLGGMVIGVVQIGSGRYLSGQTEFLGAGYSAIVPYLVMIVVLIARPGGLFGKLAVRRV